MRFSGQYVPVFHRLFFCFIEKELPVVQQPKPPSPLFFASILLSNNYLPTTGQLYRYSLIIMGIVVTLMKNLGHQ